MSHSIEVLSIFGIFAFLILLSPPLSNLTKMPLTVTEMILGALAGHFIAFMGIDKDASEISIIAEVGFLFLMFLCGLEVNIKSFGKLGSSFLWKALGYFVILYGLTFIIVLSSGLSFIYIAAFPVMSLGMIMALIKEYGRNQLWLDLVLKIGILGELLSIVALVVVDGSVRHGLSSDLGQKLLVLSLFLILVACSFKIMQVVFWWFPQIRFLFLPRDDSNSQDLRFGLFLLIAFVLLMMILEIKAVLGAFLAGCILSTFFKHKEELPKKLSDVGFGFLVPFFFVNVGYTLNLSEVFSDIHITLNALYLVGIMFVLRLFSSFMFKKYLQNIKSLLLFALSGSMPLTFLIATATLGRELNELNHSAYSSFVLAAIMEGIVFSVIIKMIYHYKIPQKQ